MYSLSQKLIRTQTLENFFPRDREQNVKVLNSNIYLLFYFEASNLR
jgi:hypothetical protein